MIQMATTVPMAFGFYLLLAGGLGREQLVSAGVLTIVALGWSTLLRVRGGPRRFAFTRAHVAPWARAIARLPADTARIGVALGRVALGRAAIAGGSPGRAAHPDFRYGPIDDSMEAARRASAVIAGSLTPDTVVVHVAPGRSSALCHKLAHTPPPANAEWLA